MGFCQESRRENVSGNALKLKDHGTCACFTSAGVFLYQRSPVQVAQRVELKKQYSTWTTSPLWTAIFCAVVEGLQLALTKTLGYLSTYDHRMFTYNRGDVKQDCKVRRKDTQITRVCISLKPSANYASVFLGEKNGISSVMSWRSSRRPRLKRF